MFRGRLSVCGLVENYRRKIYILYVIFGLVLYSFMYGFSIRWIDHAVLNYLRDSSILKGDDIFFDSAYFSAFNPYFYIHKLLIYLSHNYGINYDYMVKAMIIIYVIVSVVIIIKICESLSMHPLSTALVITAYILNINPVNVGGYSMLPTVFYPGMIGRPLLLMCIYSYLTGRYNMLYVMLGALIWIHLPYAVYFGLVFLLSLPITMRRNNIAFRDIYLKKGILALIISSGVFAVVVFKEISMVRSGIDLPFWVNDLVKIMTFGHISPYYCYYFFGIKFKLYLLLVVGLALWWSYYYMNSVKDRRYIFGSVFGIIVVSIIIYFSNFILVDIFNIPFLYKFCLNRIGWFLSFFSVLIAVYTIQDVVQSKLWRGCFNVNHFDIFKACLVFLTFFCVLILQGYDVAKNTYLRSGRSNDYWQDVCRAANITPINSRFLVPYNKIDFYSYANRISVFNRYYPSFLLTDQKIFYKVNERFNDFIYRSFLKDFVFKIKEDPMLLRENYFMREIHREWKGLDRRKVGFLKAKYGINYIIRERSLPINYPIVYENKVFCIYKVD